MNPSGVVPPIVSERTTVVRTEPGPARPVVPLKQRVQDLQTKAEDYAREDPIKAMLIALAAGYAVGKLVHLLFGVATKKKERVERIIIRSPRDIEEWPA